jgi:hypothetical protein
MFLARKRVQHLSSGATNWSGRMIESSICLLSLIICTGWSSFIGQSSSGRPPATEGGRASCQIMMVDQASRPCLDRDMTPDRAAAQPPLPAEAGTWRLLRTPGAAGHRDVVSIMQIADVSRSDMSFAGVMLRCGEIAPEMLIVLVQPLPPRAHPNVMIRAGGLPVEFTASVLPPGVLISMPPEAGELAIAVWQNSPELTVTVSNEPNTIRGVIQLAGFRAAWQALKTNCQ